MSLDKYVKKGGASLLSGVSSPSTSEEAVYPVAKKSSKPSIDKQRLLASIREDPSQVLPEKHSHATSGEGAECGISESMKQALTSSEWERVFKQNEQEILEKENLLESLRVRKDQLENRISKIKIDAKNYKKKASDSIVKNLKELYRGKRECDSGFAEYGCVTKDGISFRFVEGPLFRENRKQQELTQSELKEIEEKLKACTTPEAKKELTKTREYLCVKSKRLKSELERLCEIKRCLTPQLRARLLEKDCLFAKQHWTYNERLRLQPLQLISISTGTSNDIYRCYDIEDNEFKALKVFKHTIAAFSANGPVSYCPPEKHIVRSEVLEQLSHPNLVHYDRIVSMDRTTTHIIMEFVEGCNLEYRLAFERHLSEAEAKLILFSILSALEYLNKRVVRLPIRPKNVLLGANSSVKLIGLEEAKLCNQSGTASVQKEQPSDPLEAHYVAPEYYKIAFRSSSITLTHKSDVWAAGVLFAKMLFGVMPFEEYPGSWDKEVKKSDTDQLAKATKILISEQAKSVLGDMLNLSERSRKSASELLAHPYFR